VAPSALRFYERHGLIDSARTDGNQRRYDRAVLRRIAFIQAGRAAGVTLADIRGALEGLPTRRTPSRTDWERLSTKWRSDLDARIDKAISEVIVIGAKTFNDGDQAGCYRLYQGALISIAPLIRCSPPSPAGRSA